MFNLDDFTNENNRKHNKKWPFIPDHLYRISIIGGSGSGKINALLNLIKEQDNIDKRYQYAKDLSEPTYEFLIKKREDAGIKHFNDLNAFIECSNTMDDVYKNIDGYNPNRERKILIMFDDMIADIMMYKKFQAIINELFNQVQKIKYFTYVYPTFLFFCSKRYQIRFNTLFDHEN